MPLFKRSETTDALIRYLAMHEKGTKVTYEELSQAVSARIDSRSTSLVTARRVLEREHAQVWCCMTPKIGVWRLTDPEIAARQREWFLFGARNKLSAGAAQAEVVELDQLDMTQQARFGIDSIIRELARESLNRATMRRVEKVARGTSNDLPSFNAVEWAIALSPRRSGKGER